MAYRGSGTQALTEGSSALKLTATPQLRLIMGGLAPADAAARAHALGSLCQRSEIPAPCHATAARASYDLAREASRAHEPAPSASRVRGAVVACLLSVTLVLGMWAAGLAVRSARYDALTSAVSERVVTVQSGDSLLGLAEQHPISGLDAQETASWIQERNSLSSACLMAGQSIVVPQ